VKVRVDGERVIKVPDSPRKWSELEETLNKLGWEKLEALDANGETLRVTDNDDPSDPAEQTDAAKAGRLGEIAQIAHELRECVKAVQDGQSSTWEKVVTAAYDLANKMSEAWSRSERELAVARATIVRLEAELASAESGGGDVGATLLNAMAQGKAAADAKKQAKTNGAVTSEATE
jgi:hypothetical protein